MSQSDPHKVLIILTYVSLGGGGGGGGFKSFPFGVCGTCFDDKCIEIQATNLTLCRSFKHSGVGGAAMIQVVDKRLAFGGGTNIPFSSWGLEGGGLIPLPASWCGPCRSQAINKH